VYIGGACVRLGSLCGRGLFMWAGGICDCVGRGYAVELCKIWGVFQLFPLSFFAWVAKLFAFLVFVEFCGSSAACGLFIGMKWRNNIYCADASWFYCLNCNTRQCFLFGFFNLNTAKHVAVLVSVECCGSSAACGLFIGMKWKTICTARMPPGFIA